MKVDPSIYRVKMFRERGYIRQKCPICGEFFWSLNERPNCGDAPCSDYYFFNLKIGSPPLSVEEARQKFLKFFERNGHEVIEPYPVVARWRDDLYLTIASIVVFQPHVTSGIVPPPANPLVIAQPCIRLEDLDSVGYTFGRHLTSFIMGGHHAFNYENKKVYFSDETVELAREFFTKEIGIPESELVFKESWWEGGGNAGPSFEVAVGGLELATLVFMMYEEHNGSYREMPIKVVDTGYGIERIAWFTQRVPTAFHAIYGDLVHKYHKALNVQEPPEKVLYSAIKYVGKLNPKDPEKYAILKRNVAKELGLSEEEIGKYLDREIMVLALLDHVRTSALMLSDGIVPSNTGEGYLARLVLRRIFRILTLLDMLNDDTVSELFQLQSTYWKRTFPQISERIDYIHDVTKYELRKFMDTVKKAPQLVRKYLKKGGPGLSTDELVKLYDSHGIPPDLVVEIASRLGVNVKIPHNFYAIVAAKHGKAPIKRSKVSKLPPEIVEEVKSLNPTELLFHKDPYLREFRGQVLFAKDRYVVLDRTAFYPEGGGQAPDTGYLEIGGIGKFRVVDVQKVGNVVVHVLEKPVLLNVNGLEVHGVIDWHRRFTLMRHHTATHIILGVCRRVLGEHVWQAGAEKSLDRARLDITHYKPLTEEEIRKIEDLANKVINEGLRVNTAYMNKYEAEAKYGFRLYEGGVVLEPTIRVVEIEGLDAEACFGTHVTNTREVGAIKIVNVDRIADGVVRLEYVAGTNVAIHARELENRIAEVSRILGGDALQKARAVVEDLSRLRNLLARYRKEYLELMREKVLRSSEDVNGIRFSVIKLEIEDREFTSELLLRISKENDDFITFILIPTGNGTRIEGAAGRQVANRVPLNKLLQAIIKEFGGRGGGKPTHASGFIPKPATQELLEGLRDAIRRQLLIMTGRTT